MMLALDIKQQNSDKISPLNLSVKEEKPLLSFASLLNAVKDIHLKGESLKPSDKVSKTSSKSDFLSLLKNQPQETLNPQLTASMSSDEVKQLVYQAKKYIKSQIYSSDAFKKHEIASLPKSLKGLTQVAKKIGIDISKITLEKVQEYSLESKEQPKTMPSKTSTAFAIEQDTSEPKQKSQKSSTAFNVVQEDNAVIKPMPSKTSTAFAVEKGTPEPKQKSVKKSAAFSVVQEDKTVVKLKPSKTSTAFNDVKESPKELKMPTLKNIVQKQELQEIPLFKAQQKTEISTQELVNVKTLKQEPLHKKEKVENSLELLLRTDKASQNSTTATPLTADFSVATAKVIAPSVRTVSTKNLEALLKTSKSKSEETDTKTEVMHAPKADSFEVKLHEAKQMVKYLSHDIKTAIEDYKSPFTRVKVQLNPQKLGEVDLTIVQRGKNLHINLSSNNAAINVLAMNANDLKVQLTNSGINNATLNFNSNAQSANSQAGQQEHQRQQQQRADEEYNYFESQEGNEEVLSSLEIIVPHYA